MATIFVIVNINSKPQSLYRRHLLYLNNTLIIIINL